MEDILECRRVSLLFFYFSLSRLWEFLAGSLIYLFNLQSLFQISKWTKTLKVTTLIIILLIMLNPANLSNSIITPVVVLLTVIHLSCGEIMDRSKALGFFTWVGDRSYSIYLVHMPLMYLAKHSPALGSFLNQKLLVVMMILTSIFLGNLQFECIEKRYRIETKSSDHPTIKLIVRSLIGFIGVPVLLFGLILGSVHMDFKPLLKNLEKDLKIDSHLLVRAGCVDIEFDSSKCSWNVSQSKGNVLLVGDSQAYSVADGVKLAANRLNLNFLGISAGGCPFLLTDSTGDKPINCLKFQQSVLEYIEEFKPEFVIIANRTTGYLDPTTGWRTFLNAEGRPAKDKSEASEIYAKKLFELSTALIAVGTKVIVFQNIPELSQSVIPESVFQLAFLGSDDSRGISSRLTLNKDARKIEENLAKSGFISIYDPSLQICGFSCDKVNNVESIYSDSSHLSTKGSLSLSESMENFIKQKL